MDPTRDRTLYMLITAIPRGNVVIPQRQKCPVGTSPMWDEQRRVLLITADIRSQHHVVIGWCTSDGSVTELNALHAGKRHSPRRCHFTPTAKVPGWPFSLMWDVQRCVLSHIVDTRSQHHVVLGCVIVMDPTRNRTLYTLASAIPHGNVVLPQRQKCPVGPSPLRDVQRRVLLHIVDTLS